jgi:hypothetical protein
MRPGVNSTPVRTDKGRPVLDIVFLATGIGFLALCLGYALLCERL